MTTFSFFFREIAFSIAYSSAKQHWSFLSSSSIACAWKNMLSQESQKMYLECSVAIKCHSNFSIRCIARMLRLIEKWYGMKRSENPELKKTHGRATTLPGMIPSIDACFLQLQFCTHCTPPFLFRVVDVEVVFSAILAPLFPLSWCQRTAKIAKIHKLMKIYIWWGNARTSEANVFPFAVFHSFSQHIDRLPNFILAGPLLDNNIWIKSNQTNNLNDLTKQTNTPWPTFGRKQLNITTRSNHVQCLEPNDISCLYFSFKIFGPCKRCFPLWKLSFSVASSPYYLPMLVH